MVDIPVDLASLEEKETKHEETYQWITSVTDTLQKTEFLLHKLINDQTGTDNDIPSSKSPVSTSSKQSPTYHYYEFCEDHSLIKHNANNSKLSIKKGNTLKKRDFDESIILNLKHGRSFPFAESPIFKSSPEAIGFGDLEGNMRRKFNVNYIHEIFSPSKSVHSDNQNNSKSPDIPPTLSGMLNSKDGGNSTLHNNLNLIGLDYQSACGVLASETTSVDVNQNIEPDEYLVTLKDSGVRELVYDYDEKPLYPSPSGENGRISPLKHYNSAVSHGELSYHKSPVRPVGSKPSPISRVKRGGVKLSSR